MAAFVFFLFLQIFFTHKPNTFMGKILAVRPENPKPVQNLQVLILRQTKFFSYRNPYKYSSLFF